MCFSSTIGPTIRQTTSSRFYVNTGLPNVNPGLVVVRNRSKVLANLIFLVATSVCTQIRRVDFLRPSYSGKQAQV